MDSESEIRSVIEEKIPEAGSVAMFNKLSKMADEFMRTVQELKAQASSSRQGKAESLRLPEHKSRKRSLNFSPPRGGRVLVPATQDDDEMETDSLSSHTYRPRKRLLAPWKLILVKQKSKSSKQEVMQEFSDIAESDLLKSGFSAETRAPANGLGGFKPAQVIMF